MEPDGRAQRRVDWLARAQQGDAEAYRAFLNDVMPSLTRYLRRRVYDAHDVDDVLQETMLAMHRVRHTWQPPRPVEPWMYAIAKRMAARHAERRGRRSGREVLRDAPPAYAGETWAPAGALLFRSLSALPPRQREAIELLQVRGLSLDSAAVRAGTTVGALKVRAHRAYKALRALLFE